MVAVAAEVSVVVAEGAMVAVAAEASVVVDTVVVAVVAAMVAVVEVVVVVAMESKWKGNILSYLWTSDHRTMNASRNAHSQSVI